MPTLRYTHLLLSTLANARFIVVSLLSPTLSFWTELTMIQQVCCLTGYEHPVDPLTGNSLAQSNVAHLASYIVPETLTLFSSTFIPTQ